MTTTFDGYKDAFAVTPWNNPAEESTLHKLLRENRKLKKKNKELKRTIKEQSDAEEKRIAEQRIAEEARKKENSLWSRIGDAVVKAIPAIIGAVIPFIMKGFFSRRKELRYT